MIGGEEMGKELSFKASSSIKNLFGKNLVTDQFNAVFELVKNAYDADADKTDITLVSSKRRVTEKDIVKSKEDVSDEVEVVTSIIIEDDGCGMTLEDIREKWMIIGTSNKINNPFSVKYGRAVTGDKGIGRFSTDRLGKKLVLTAYPEKESYAIRMEFDWEKFENDIQNIETIRIPYENVEKIKGKGVRLEIVDLRDEWTENDLEKLMRKLRTLKSPFSLKNDMEITVTSSVKKWEKEVVESWDLKSISSLWVAARVDENDLSTICIEINSEAGKYVETLPNPYSFGAINSEIYFFGQGDKVSFANRVGKTVRDFGNVHLYRDGFRVYPYGESNNDWLDLDRRKAQGMFRFFGTRDLVGVIGITKDHNPQLKPLTNRQGLEENEAYEEIRDFIVKICIRKLENHHLKPRNSTASVQHAQKASHESIVELRNIIKDIAPAESKTIRSHLNLIENSLKKQASFIKEQEKTVEILTNFAQKEIVLSEVMHDIAQKVATLEKKSRRLSKKAEEEGISSNLSSKIKDLESFAEHTTQYITQVKDSLVTRKKLVEFDLVEFIKMVMSENSVEFEEYRINTKVGTELEKCKIKADKTDFKRIINNLISNAIKSLKQVNRVRRLIVNINQYGESIFVHIEDNGIGIPIESRDEIFLPFTTTTGGMGLGLSIVRALLRTYDGDLLLGPYKEDEQGAEFIVKIKGRTIVNETSTANINCG